MSELKKQTNRAAHAAKRSEHHANTKGIVLQHILVNQEDKRGNTAMKKANTAFNDKLSKRFKETDSVKNAAKK